jgi:hypothetical protein
MSNSLDVLKKATILISVIFILLQHILNIDLRFVLSTFAYIYILNYIINGQECEPHFTFLIAERSFYTNKSTFHCVISCEALM